MELFLDPAPGPDPQVPGGPVPPDWVGAGAPRMGRYRLGPRLGRGGMGEVREAWDTLLHRRVAIKLLTALHPAAILRFMREAQFQARVTHPNVCRVYDVDTSGGVPFIAMQLVPGPDLLQAAPGLALEQVAELLHAVALAIHAAHRLNLVHRDIKPSNILLEPDGQGGWSAYVADFGLAKDLGGDSASQTRVPLGTPEYMAPEQRRGEPGATGPAVDVYALGATLQVAAGLARHAGLPAALGTIIARCLEERPQDRYASAGALAEDLRRYLDGEPLLVRRRWPDLGRWLGGHRILVAALGACLVLGSAAVAGLARKAVRNRGRQARAERIVLEGRDLEHALRIERLIPIHDLRPARARMFEWLSARRTELPALGPEAAGPCCLALGRGYAALGEPERALEVLDSARPAGREGPQAARTLARVHLDCALRLAGDLRPGGADRSLAGPRNAHLREARAAFERFRASGARPEEGTRADLVEAGLLVQEGAFAAGLARARAVFGETPWRYEAKVEESRALAGLAAGRARAGDRRAAASLFREAQLAARAAEAIGESDESVYLADLEGRIRCLDLLPLEPRAEAAAWDRAEALADQALALDPDHPAALDVKVYVVLRRAGARLRAGKDPRPDLDRAERYLAPWTADPALGATAAVRRRWIQCLRAGFRMARGLDPGAELEWALGEDRGGIWTLEALVLGARWAVRRGQDPGPWLQAFWRRPEAGLPEADQPRRRDLQDQARRLAAGGRGRESGRFPR
jgi:serine/threonine-protein kinase